MKFLIVTLFSIFSSANTCQSVFDIDHNSQIELLSGVYSHHQIVNSFKRLLPAGIYALEGELSMAFSKRAFEAIHQEDQVVFRLDGNIVTTQFTRDFSNKLSGVEIRQLLADRRPLPLTGRVEKLDQNTIRIINIESIPAADRPILQSELRTEMTFTKDLFGNVGTLVVSVVSTSQNARGKTVVNYQYGYQFRFLGLRQ